MPARACNFVPIEVARSYNGVADEQRNHNRRDQCADNQWLIREIAKTMSLY